MYRIWKGTLGIQDSPEIHCRIRENAQFLYPIRELTATREAGFAKIWKKTVFGIEMTEVRGAGLWWKRAGIRDQKLWVQWSWLFKRRTRFTAVTIILSKVGCWWKLKRGSMTRISNSWTNRTPTKIITVRYWYQDQFSCFCFLQPKGNANIRFFKNSHSSIGSQFCLVTLY